MSGHQPLAYLGIAHQIAFKESIPWFATIELGLNCNLLCNHCYNFDRSTLLKAPTPKLNSQKIFKIVDELKSLGTLMISFTGGEVLLDPNLFTYIKYVRDKNLLVKIKSNGTLITSKIASEFKNLGVYDIDISLYGSNSSSHNWLTNIENSFEKTIKGIKKLRENDLSVNISYILTKKNFLEIDSMIKLAKDLSSNYSFTTDLTDRYDHTNFQKIALDEDDFNILLQSKHRELFEHENSPKSFQCECARTVVAISSEGDVYPCIGAPIKSGNVFENSLVDIWNYSNEFFKIRNLTNEDFIKCNSCEFSSKCSRSSGSSFVNTGEYTGPNPQSCVEAKARFLN